MCIPHIRVGGYANQLEGGMSAQLILHGRFLFLLGLFVSFSGCYSFILEREERKTISERGRWRGRSRFPASESLPWDLDHDLSLRQKLN